MAPPRVGAMRRESRLGNSRTSRADATASITKLTWVSNEGFSIKNEEITARQTPQNKLTVSETSTVMSTGATAMISSPSNVVNTKVWMTRSKRDKITKKKNWPGASAPKCRRPKKTALLKRPATAIAVNQVVRVCLRAWVSAL